MRHIFKLLISLAATLFAFNAWAADSKLPVRSAEEKAIGQACIKCHADESPGIVGEWKKSRHNGKQYVVDCYSCHQAKEGEKWAYKHEKHNGKDIFITTIPTPKNCAVCHKEEVAQQQPSHHAKAGQILGSLDNIMGEVIGGPEAVNAGCRQCHGGDIVLDHRGKPTMETWPNTGIGRGNPDGSLGSCSACHARHRFSSAQARTPDTCGKCHLGPDHPQMEVYNESKHGILYRAHVDEMNLKSKKWVAGVDYSAAPTCATCHMSATRKQKTTHDVGERISWTLRPPISQKLNMIRLESGDEYDLPEGNPIPKVGDIDNSPKGKGAKVKEVLTWEDRRGKMKNVCYACHASDQVKGHYKQFDDVVNLYNEKFAKPIAAAMKDLVAQGYITAAPFDDKIEWTWWEIWHHEGRRARHGASMMGPDYTWWHGIYEVAQHTYFKWIPELKEAVRKKDGNEDAAKAILEKHFKPIQGHDWYFSGISKESIEKTRAAFEERYGKGSMK